MRQFPLVSEPLKTNIENYIKAKDIEKMVETMRPYIKCDEK